MPRGKYVNHKGRSRHFTNPEELEQELKKKKKNKRTENEDTDSNDEESSESLSEKAEGSDSEGSSDDSSDNHKAKGVSGLIEIENPNRVQKKANSKVSSINVSAVGGPSKPELSRREREEVERQRAQAHYQKLHAEGKTEQARADLARLAIIKQNRADAAARRDAEKKEKEDRARKTLTKT